MWSTHESHLHLIWRRVITSRPKIPSTLVLRWFRSNPAKTRSKTGDVIRRGSQITWFNRITASTWVTWIWPDLRLVLGRRLQ